MGYVGVNRDITEQKKSEETIRENQKRLNALTSQLTIVEERERSRIATELHDHVGTTLAYTRIQLEEAKSYTAKARLLAILDEISQSLLKTIQETRTLVFDLSSPLLVELGLSSAINNWLDERIRKKFDLKVQFIDDKSERKINRDLRAILFRNVRELVTNVVKHSHASEVVVSIDHTNKDITIMVHDDGVGSSPDDIFGADMHQKKFGLFSIRERMEDFRGSLTMSSEPGMGCKAILFVSF